MAMLVQLIDDVVANFGDGPVRDSRGGGQAEEESERHHS